MMLGRNRVLIARKALKADTRKLETLRNRHKKLEVCDQTPECFRGGINRQKNDGDLTEKGNREGAVQRTKGKIVRKA